MVTAAPNIPICASHDLTGIEAITAPNGRSARLPLLSFAGYAAGRAMGCRLAGILFNQLAASMPG